MAPPIDFHSHENRDTYTTRQADPSWVAAVTGLVDPRGKRVLDIGCGGGIYSRAWAGLGAAEVLGVDFSHQMVEAAAERSQGMAGVSFRQGDATATGLNDGCADLVFERALIHHVADWPACLREAYRLLRPGGAILLQDRTPKDVRQPATPEHIRGYFFERFPRLLAVEDGRRPRSADVVHHLEESGFGDVRTLTLWETRQVYRDLAALAADLRGRTGRSILHELSDDELETLIAYIGDHVSGAVTEKDRWTLWYGECST